MEHIADLHIHSVFSDGLLTPEQIFIKAKDNGISAISITDHDSIDGNIIALELSSKYDIDFLTGVEFSCYDGGREYHILAYGLDVFNEHLRLQLGEFQVARYRRAEIIHQKLASLGVDIDFDLIVEKAGKAPISRPHIATALVDLGVVTHYKEAFERLIGDGCPAYEPKLHFAVDKAIQLINECGGVAVLAHPGHMVNQSTLYKIIKFGLDGIEVVHPMHNAYLQRYYHSIASQYWLIETGGSDYHGTRSFDEDNFGRFVVPIAAVESIRTHIGEA
ncbi:MAG: PHP domain-containing protein [Candidatus Kapaibacterium sp.]